jgi:Sulfotransferase family
VGTTGHNIDSIAVCPNPVFVVGSPRSGTTILGRSLAEHTELWTSGESYALFHLFGPRDFAGQTFDRSMAIPGPRWLRRENVGREEFLAYVGLGINALMTNRSGGRRWVDHTPLYTKIVGPLAEVFAGASFIHILRDGREVVNSMLNFVASHRDPEGKNFIEKTMPWASDVSGGCETWREHVETAMAFCEEHPDRAMVLRYEDLVADPAATFGSIHGFLGIADEDGPAKFLSNRRINSSFDDRPRLSGSELWETWAADLRHTFAAHAGTAMVRSGYWTPDEFENARRLARL